MKSRKDEKHQGLTKPTESLFDKKPKPNEQSMEGSVEGVDKTMGPEKTGLKKPTASLPNTPPDPKAGESSEPEEQRGPSRPGMSKGS